MNITDHKKKNNLKYLILFSSLFYISTGTINPLFSQSVTNKTAFNFGEVVLSSPGIGSVTLAGTNRTPSGNALIIPSHPGTLSLASFTYKARGKTNITSVTIDQISVGTGTNITVNDFIISPPLPISLNNNQTQVFTVTQAKISFNGVVAPGVYTSTPSYIVRINGTAY